MSTPEHRPDLLVSDAEREATVDRLRAGAAEGRLDADELERRVSAAYAARTHADLDAVVAGLPEPPASRVPVVARPDGLEFRRRTAAFLVPNVVCVLIWLATGADSSFWPIWVLLGTGIAYVVWIIRAVLGVEDDERPPAT